MSDDEIEETVDWEETTEATRLRVTVPADADVTEDEVRDTIEDLFDSDGADEGSTESSDDEDEEEPQRRYSRGHCS